MSMIDADAIENKLLEARNTCLKLGLEANARVIECDIMRIKNSLTIKTKQIKYYDEDENVWKTGEVIVDE